MNGECESCRKSSFILDDTVLGRVNLTLFLVFFPRVTPLLQCS